MHVRSARMPMSEILTSAGNLLLGMVLIRWCDLALGELAAAAADIRKVAA